jgi:hypothetical protein
VGTYGQNNLKLKYENSSIYAGIDIGSKGVKLSILEVGKNAKKNGTFNVLKDTAINTDFISFTQSSFQNTLNGLGKLYNIALKDFNIPSEKIFTVVSSGIKIQADKEEKQGWITQFINAFKANVADPSRAVPIIDVVEEARLSHLGIVPDSRRFNTFLIDIGSGNTKGGYFPNGNTKELKLFQLSWGTKSTANATEKRCEEDKSLVNYKRQLERVVSTAEKTEIVYAINESGAYPMSDNIAFSGGISWSLANLMYPELYDNSVVPITYDDLAKFNERLYTNYASVTDSAIVRSIADPSIDKIAVGKEVKRVNQVFDQRALMAGTGLLLKIMRQFEGVWEKKQFYLVKNGQVGWISAYVDKTINK